VLILDKDVLTIVQRGSGPEFGTRLGRLQSADDEVYVTILSFEEQVRGWLAFVSGARSTAREVFAYSQLRLLLDDFGDRLVLDYDDDAAAEFRRLSKARLRIGSMDLRIAAVALSRDATLISRNLRDFRKVPGLDVRDWTAVNA
jgi:tRNA(fMet)-specific endonuclease VapC